MDKSPLAVAVGVIALLTGLTLPATGHTELVSYEFTGTVQFVQSGSDDALAVLSDQNITPGASVYGSYTLDTDTPGFGGQYNQAAPEVTFVVGDLVAEIPAPVFGSTLVTVRTPTVGAHLFDLYAAIVPLGGLFSTVDYSLMLVDSSGTAFSEGGIPNPLPDLDAFDPYTGNIQSTRFGVVIDTEFGLATAIASIDTHAQVVPIPGAVVLLTSGLVGLTLLSRRRKYATAG